MFEKLFKNVTKSTSKYTIEWHLDDNLDNGLKEKQYDVNASLKAFMKRKKFSESKIDEIMQAKNPVLKLKNLYRTPSKPDLLTIYCDEAIRFDNWNTIWLIENPKEPFVFENTALYFCLKIAQLFDWDMKNKRQGTASLQNKFLKDLSNNNDEEVLKYISSNMLNCFGYAQKMQNISVSEAVEIGLKHLELNAQHINSTFGSFYLTYGKNNVEAIIYKIIECAYRSHKFTVGSILKKEINK